jgi:hypothetical protein
MQARTDTAGQKRVEYEAENMRDDLVPELVSACPLVPEP